MASDLPKSNAELRIEACAQLENEMGALVNRYAEESDLTFRDVLGVIEKVKFDMNDTFTQYHNKRMEG